jgi:hypothetical protein
VEIFIWIAQVESIPIAGGYNWTTPALKEGSLIIVTVNYGLEYRGTQIRRRRRWRVQQKL